MLPSPTERVIALSSQGLSEPEIIQTLRQEGYNPIQVDGAMREALRGAATGAQPRPAQRYAPAQQYGPPVQEYAPPAPAGPARRPGPPRPYPAYDEEFPDEQEQAPAYARPGPTPQPQPGQVPEPPMDFDDFRNANSELGFPEIPGREPAPREIARPRARMLPPEDDLDEEEEPELRPMPRFAARDRTRGEARLEKRNMIEELTEGVVEEKWTDFRRRMDEMSMMFQQLSQRISSLEEKIGMSHEEKNKDLLEVEGKIDNYKQTMDEIESRMESIERAMKDSLTPMMQTLRSLSDTLKVMKEKRV